ncbi:MAG: sterol desaturase family protein [Gammaproteobacteria bacterium]|jgi:sterol desaturase/sphingolipid hydroxylase (fatty acid hydroxylase superfamily)
MDLQFFIILGVILAFDGVLMSFMAWAAQSSSLKQYRIRTPTTYRIPKLKKAINIGLNGMLSMVFFAAMLYHFGDYLMDDEPVNGVAIFGEVLASLLLYDFMYYFLHRGMHHPKFMKYVHGVHHYVRFPTSTESIYLHPVENLAGLGLLCIAMMLVGPISAVSFLIVFFIHSTVNILVHSNLVLPHPAFKLFNFWAVKHDLHHGKHLNRNYASIFPFWDQMFGTYA